MKKILVLLLVSFGFIAKAQSPRLNVKGVDSVNVKMNQLVVNVKIAGNIAYTTAEMHFFNKGTKQLEAELLFPLPEGVSVSRYALDINGKMREAVPVNKSKGKQVFEAIERRRVDPGLLEKTEGNNFKTRIYPILPNGERIVIIGYEQELSNFDKNNLAYQLQAKYPHLIEKFEVTITVLGSKAQPQVISDVNGNIPLTNIWNQSFQTSIKKTNYKPSEKLLIKIPIQEEIPSIVMQSINDQHYFYANTIIESKKAAKKNPGSIGLIWDVSLSCKNRDLAKEMNLLDEYFKHIKNTQVTLYLLSYNFDKNQTYTVSDGDWSALRRQLEKTKYDGGTRYSKIKLQGNDEYLLFSDGLSSLSNNQLEKTNKPVYTITSLASADYSFLNYNALKTKGSFINLNKLNIEQAVDKMLNSNLKFLGIKENYFVTEVYPAIGAPVSGNFSFSGISLKPKNEVTLLFGYNETPTVEKKIILDAESQNTNDVNIEKLWAQKKIADLELQYTKNVEEIETMGQKYGIVTKNTSLIVLENINDYIAYDIVPPAELRPEFDRIIKQQRENRLAQQHSNWDNIGNHHNSLQSWWNKNLKYTTKPVAKSKAKVPPPPRAPRVSEARFVKPGVVEISGKADGHIADDDVPSGIGEPEEAVEEVQGVELYSIANTGSTNKRNDQPLEKIIPEGNSSTRTRTKRSSATVNSDSDIDPRDQKYEIKLTSWSPDRLYLRALSAASKDKKYEVYLELRETEENNPSFYFDVANHFYNSGDRQKALLVLSNIADLGLENHQLYKSLTYLLRQWESYEDALFTAHMVAKWRKHEPQSHRDLGLTFEDNKQFQAAFDELTKALEVQYYGEMTGTYEGIEDIILMDINRLVSEHKGIDTSKLDKKYLSKMPVEIRIILNWNQQDTDIDLHVIEPTHEECYFSHKTTQAGGRFSKDFTQGYGPEQYLLRNAVKGKYQIKTNYYGETTLSESGPTTVMVEIYTTNKKGVTTRKLKTIQLGKVKQNQNLAEIALE